MGKLGRIALFCVLLTSGCTSVPNLPEDGIAIGEIVQRIKCEIAFAVPQPQPPWPTGRFQWMHNWSAKVDLTLMINSKATVSPTVVFPTLAPHFTLGLGASLETSADRTEVMSFSLSFAEMREFRRQGVCNPPGGSHLYGHLGLREWLQSALAPVEAGQLKVGRHPPPGGKSASPPPVRPVIKTLALDPLEPLVRAKDVVEHYAREASAALAKAKQYASRDEIQPTYDQADLIYSAVDRAAPGYREAEKLAAGFLKSHPALKERIESLLATAKSAAETINAAKAGVDVLIGGLPRDPPIDSLSHSVKFVVAVSGSATPNWVLVNFRGPAVSGSLLSGTYSRSHTLSIAMGTAAEQVRQLNNLIIIQTLNRPTP